MEFNTFFNPNQEQRLKQIIDRRNRETEIELDLEGLIEVNEEKEESENDMIEEQKGTQKTVWKIGMYQELKKMSALQLDQIFNDQVVAKRHEIQAFVMLFGYCMKFNKIRVRRDTKMMESLKYVVKNLKYLSNRQFSELVYNLEKIKGWVDSSHFNKIEQELIERAEQMELRQLGLCLYSLMKVERRGSSIRKEGFNEDIYQSNDFVVFDALENVVVMKLLQQQQLDNKVVGQLAMAYSKTQKGSYEMQEFIQKYAIQNWDQLQQKEKVIFVQSFRDRYQRGGHSRRTIWAKKQQQQQNQQQNDQQLTETDHNYQQILKLSLDYILEQYQSISPSSLCCICFQLHSQDLIPPTFLDKLWNQIHSVHTQLSILDTCQFLNMFAANRFIYQGQKDVYHLLMNNVVILKQNLEQNGVTLILENIDWIVEQKFINQMQLKILLQVLGRLYKQAKIKGDNQTVIQQAINRITDHNVQDQFNQTIKRNNPRIKRTKLRFKKHRR